MVEDFCRSMHITEKIIFGEQICKSEVFQIQWRGNEDFHWSKPSRIYSCQMWSFHDFVKSGILFPMNLVAKHDLRKKNFQKWKRWLLFRTYYIGRTRSGTSFEQFGFSHNEPYKEYLPNYLQKAVQNFPLARLCTSGYSLPVDLQTKWQQNWGWVVVP